MDRKLDLLILGGGINGAALARQASCAGLATMLVEREDFARGASSNSSKMAHGGVRYLESFDFGLVREAARARGRLARMAPHLVKERQFLFPLVSEMRWPRLSVPPGLLLYHALAWPESMRAPGWVGPRVLARREPAFRGGSGAGGPVSGSKTGSCWGACTYADCMMDDARLVIENLVDAETAGAVVRNWTEAVDPTELLKPEGGVTLHDRITGASEVVYPQKIALAVGAWTDVLLEQADRREASRHWTQMLRVVPDSAGPGSDAPAGPPSERASADNPPLLLPSQGAHLFLEGFPTESPFILPVPGTGRYLFVLPWRGGHLVGTTETPVERGAGGDCAVRPVEVAEMTELLGRYFPGVPVNAVCTTVGVRPLAAELQRREGDSVSASRRHRFLQVGGRTWAGFGGKYTTHQEFAAELLRALFGRELPSVMERPFPGVLAGPDVSREGLVRAGVSGAGSGAAPGAKSKSSAPLRWAATYGSRGREISEFLERAGGDELVAEALFCREREWARTAADFLRRRGNLFFGTEAGAEVGGGSSAGVLARLERVFGAGSAGGSLGVQGDYGSLLRAGLHRASKP